jgi:chemotaxis protein MotA
MTVSIIFSGLIVWLTPEEQPSRILIMAGGVLPAGLIQAFTFFLFFFGMTEVLWINSRLTYEKDSFIMHLLPEKENWVLSTDDVKNLKLKIQDVERSQKFYLTDLIKKCCTKYALSKSSSEVMALTEAQLRIYQAELENEQSFIRYVIWAIPSVGFIGTVIGIAASLGYAKDASSASGIEKVTDALAVAFDTTLVALILSIILMYVVHSIQKKQDDLFIRINVYVIENLINRFYK